MRTIDFRIDYKGNKAFRLLNIYERLNKGEGINKESLSAEFGVSQKTVQRDIDDLRAYLTEMHFAEEEVSIKYVRSENRYYLVRFEREWFTNEEALALCKILLESRAFNKDENSKLIEKLILQISPQERRFAENIIRNEFMNYIPLRHNKPLLTSIWQLSKNITDNMVIEFNYTRQDGKVKKKTVMPVSVLFSEFYFYLIAFDESGSMNFPIVFRIDRMTDTKETGRRFEIPYKNRFNDGEFRKRIQFMYAGELKTVTFEYTGVLEAILDRLPTAKILKEENGVYTISAETYGDGIYMWLHAQGEKAKIL